MLTVYQISFRAGVLFTVVTFIFGQLFDFLDIDIDFDGDVDFDTDIQVNGVFPLKPAVITAFFTVFGGIGEMALGRGMGQIFTFALASALGIVVATMLHKLIITPLKRAQNTSAKSQKELVGHHARVDVGIEGEHFGRISYSIGGNSYTAPAKSIHGTSIHRGNQVIISKIENNIFFVEEVGG